mgnify:CR=1 FL=1
MDIQNLSEATLEKLIGEGFIKSYRDVYHLDRYKNENLQIPVEWFEEYNKLIKEDK